MITAENFRWAIGRDVRVEIFFYGPITQGAIQKLIDLLECERDVFPEKEPSDLTPNQDRSAAPSALARLCTEESVAQN